MNSKKVDKSAYFQSWLNQPWTRAKIAPNLIKMGVHTYLSNGYLNILFKTQFQETWQKWIFLNLVWPTLKKCKNSSKYHKNRFPYLSLKWVPNSTFDNFEKVNKSASFQTWFDQPWTRAKITPNLIKISVHAYLSNGYLNLL